MNISKEAIEAAKGALYKAAGKRFVRQPIPPWSEARKDAMTEAHQDELAHAALKAAGPLLMAQALREVHAWSEEQHPWIGLMDLKQHIEDRANELEES